jgi:hypothetical protein
MDFYIIRHLATGQIMPLARLGKGYSFWNPSKGAEFISKLDVPRLFRTVEHAEKVISAWASRPNLQYKYSALRDSDELVCNPDGRKFSDLGIEKVTIKL